MLEDEFWNQDTIIKDLIFQSNLSNQEIAVEVGMTIQQLNKRMKQLGLDWVNKRKRKFSRGQESLFHIMEQLFPGEDIVMEHPIIDGMRLDIFCPKYRLAAEYHGRQHFFYSDFFYDSRREFREAKARDEKKIQWCKDNGITLVAFSFTDDLNKDIVFDRLLHALQAAPVAKLNGEVGSSKKMNYNKEFYEKVKKKNKEKNKVRYRRLKELRDKEKSSSDHYGNRP